MNSTNGYEPEAATDVTTILTEDEDRHTTDDEGTGSDGEQDEDVETNSGKMQGEGDDTGKRSAIKKHLLSNSQCRSVYDDSCFTILCRARKFSELKVLEAVFIRKHNPNLCIQKENDCY